MLKRFQFPTGWNSTLLLCLHLLYYHYVSIPNGMEFYFLPRFLNVKPSRRFNSQRDGILLEAESRLDLDLSVSIPNGMEFYCTAILSPFQIP